VGLEKRISATFKLQQSKSVRWSYHFDAECDGSSRSLIHAMRGYSCD
jgi:hypothetical protein